MFDTPGRVGHWQGGRRRGEGSGRGRRGGGGGGGGGGGSSIRAFVYLSVLLSASFTVSGLEDSQESINPLAPGGVAKCKNLPIYHR